MVLAVELVDADTGLTDFSKGLDSIITCPKRHVVLVLLVIGILQFVFLRVIIAFVVLVMHHAPSQARFHPMSYCRSALFVG